MYKYGLQPDEIIGIGDSFKLAKKGYQKQKTLDIAKSIMDGYLFSNYLFSDNPRIIHGGIDWDVKFSDSPSTYNLGLQTLDMVAILCFTYLDSKEIAYLTKAYLILQSWVKYAKESPKSNYVWYDHSVSSRILNVIYFLSTKNVDNQTQHFFATVDETLLINILREHANYLLNPTNYSYGNNHGVMADRALISLGIFLPNDPESDTWLTNGLRRMRTQFRILFQSDGSYAENSPGYAQGALFWFVEMQNFLERHGCSLIEGDFNDLIAPIYRFLMDSTMPNGHYPMWGDTIDAKANHINAFYSPETGLSIYQDGGYGFLKEDDIWLGIKSGYIGGMAHKHEDDLSFVLYAMGKDIFVDSGMYNYEKADPYRKYFISANAHNTIVVDGKSFPTSLINDKRSGILSWENNNNYKSITAFNNLYDAVSIHRSIYYLKIGVIVIFDNIQSLTNHTYSQLFHLHEDIVVNEALGHLELHFESKNKVLKMYQLIGRPVQLIRKGNKNIPGYGLLSRNLNEMTETNTIEYKIDGQQGSFITVIDLTKSHSAQVSGCETDGYTVTVTNDVNQHQVDIFLHSSPRKVKSYSEYSSTTQIKEIPVSIIKKRIDKRNFVYEIKKRNILNGDYIYTWYLWKNGIVERKYNWSDKNVLELINLEPGVYEIQAYLRDKVTDDRSTGIIDKLFI